MPTNRLLVKIKYPDGDDVSDNVALTYHADGSLATRTDQRGVTIAYTYDDAGRRTDERVTAAPSSVGGDRQVTYAYADLGQIERVTTYATISGTATSEVLNTFDGYGSLKEQYQAHGGTVTVGVTPVVTYGRNGAFGKGNRLETMTYPNGRVLHYTYDSGIDAAISRVSAIADDNGSGGAGQELARYSYLGLNTAVEVSYPEPGITLDYVGTGTSGNDYDGFDRFGRVVDHRWIETAGGTDVGRFEYGYDRASNRVWRNNPLTTGHDEFYTYDGLHRLTGMTRGDLNGTLTGIVSAGATFAQDWSLDPLGNWDGFQQDDNGDGSSGWGLDQMRTHNDVNEITGFTGGGWVTPTHDAAGNMTKLPQPNTAGGPTQGFDATYDPWNRLVKLADSGTSQTVAEYTYNGLGWRITKKIYAADVLDETRYSYYSNDWRLLENRVDGTSSTNTEKQYVWGLRYIDDLVGYDQDGVGNLDQRQYALSGVNYNIMSIATTSGIITERYEYSPYGERFVLDADYSDDADGISDIGNDIGHQGLMHDEKIGLIYNRARMLNSGLGRFMQRDPLGYVDGKNLYQYVGSNPTVRIDPLGYFYWKSCTPWTKKPNTTSSWKKVAEYYLEKQKISVPVLPTTLDIAQEVADQLELLPEHALKKPMTGLTPGQIFEAWRQGYREGLNQRVYYACVCEWEKYEDQTRQCCSSWAGFEGSTTTESRQQLIDRKSTNGIVDPINEYSASCVCNQPGDKPFSIYFPPLKSELPSPPQMGPL